MNTAPSAQPKSSLAILLLEDQGLVRAGMRELIQLSEPRARLREAAGYDEAVALLDRYSFDIAFLDFDLKGEKTGLDVLRYMRDRELDTRAIMLSGNADKAVVMQCLEAGASGYILKDMDGEGLFRRALDTVFQGSVFLPASVLGRGGYSPTPQVEPTRVSAESLGIGGRTLEVLYYLSQGLSNKLIARNMGIEPGTVQRDYMPKLMQKFGARNRTEIVVEISRRGLIIPAPAAR